MTITDSERYKPRLLELQKTKQSGTLYLPWDAFRVDHFFKHVDHVIELPVDVSNDYDRLLDPDHIRLVACTLTNPVFLVNIDRCINNNNDDDDEKMKEKKRGQITFAF